MQAIRSRAVVDFYDACGCVFASEDDEETVELGFGDGGWIGDAEALEDERDGVGMPDDKGPGADGASADLGGDFVGVGLG